MDSPTVASPSSAGGSSDYIALAAIFVAASLSNIVYALTGFGNSILFIVFWQIIFLVLGRGTPEDSLRRFAVRRLSASARLSLTCLVCVFVEDASNDLVQVVVLNFLMNLVSVLPMLAITRRDIHWGPLLWVGIPCFGGTALGTVLLLSTKPELAKLLLGIVFILFSAWRVAGEILALDKVRRSACLAPGTVAHVVLSRVFPGTLSSRHPHHPAPNQDHSETALSASPLTPSDLAWWISTEWGSPMSWPLRIGSSIAGFMSGLLRGMFGAGGPPLMIYVSLVSMDKAQVRALSNMLGLWMAPLSFALLLRGGGFSAERWPSYVITVGGSIAGLVVGARMFSWFDTATVMRGILVLLILASVVMLNPPFAFTLVVFALAALVVAGYVAWRLYSRSQEPQRVGGDDNSTIVIAALDSKEDRDMPAGNEESASLVDAAVTLDATRFDDDLVESALDDSDDEKTD